MKIAPERDGEAMGANTDIERDLRAMWTAQGVPTERQDELVAKIAAKAAPGAQVGPFKLSAEIASHPKSWGTELVRNPAGRAFWFVSRFVSRTGLEYVEDATGKPKCFRIEREALAAAAQRNASASQATV